jgi:threonine-phosphate decarboxylase
LIQTTAYEHGGNIDQVAKRFKLDLRAILDFSSNINPLGIPKPLQEMFLSNLDRLTRYPDPEYRTLRESIARYLNVPPSKIIPGNGASEIIFLLLSTLKPKNLLLCAPTFAEYENAAQAAAVNVRYLTLSEDNEYQLEMTKLIAILEKVDCILLCNPNNPTSTLVAPEELRGLLEQTKRKRVNVIIDESFIELTLAGNRNSMVPWLESYENLFIIRSFTKIFAIPGLRLGYGLGAPQYIEKMNRNKLPWSVNAMASIVGDYLFQSHPFFEKTSQWLVTEKSWLFEELQKIVSVKAFPPQSNFILVKIVSSQLTTTELQNKMAANGVLIRNAANFRSLNEQFFRVAVKDRVSNEHLIRLLRKELGE